MHLESRATGSLGRRCLNLIAPGNTHGRAKRNHVLTAQPVSSYTTAEHGRTDGGAGARDRLDLRRLQ